MSRAHTREAPLPDGPTSRALCRLLRHLHLRAKGTPDPQSPRDTGSVSHQPVSISASSYGELLVTAALLTVSRKCLVVVHGQRGHAWEATRCLAHAVAHSHFSLHPLPRSIPGLSVDSPQPSPSARKSPLSLSPAFQVALGPAERGSSPLLSPVLSDAGQARTDDEEEPKHKVGAALAEGLLLVGPCLQPAAGQGSLRAGWGPPTLPSEQKGMVDWRPQRNHSRGPPIMGRNSAGTSVPVHGTQGTGGGQGGGDGQAPGEPSAS